MRICTITVRAALWRRLGARVRATLAIMIATGASLSSCKKATDADPIVTEMRMIEAWLADAGARVEVQRPLSSTNIGREISWRIVPAKGRATYRLALIATEPLLYRPCSQDGERLICRRTLPADSFVVEVEPAPRGSPELLARFRATPF